MKIPAELRNVAQRLGGDLRNRVVFVGGMIRGILVTDPAAGPARPTRDVDLIVDVSTHAEYARLTETLRSRGFRESTEAGAPICRWIVDGILTDVIPVDPRILGFSNVWYVGARASSALVADENGQFRILDAPRFCATKLESHASRGEGDYYHHDIEDFIALIDGRPTLVSEIMAAPNDLRAFLSARAGSLLEDAGFMDALPGHLPSDEASQSRLPQVVAKLRTIVALAETPEVAATAIEGPMVTLAARQRHQPSALGASQHRFSRSSNLLNAGYDETSRTLTIEFRNRRLYAYSAVPPELYRGLTGAYSAGRYFSLWIKRRYRFKRLR